jgi:hypothetical protein
VTIDGKALDGVSSCTDVGTPPSCSCGAIHRAGGGLKHFLRFGGRDGIRTHDLLVANEALSQLSYSPTSSNKILADAPNVAN